MKYLEQIVALNRSIVGCKNVNFQDLTALPAGEPEHAFVEERRSLLHPSIADFYQQLKSYNLKWESKPKVLPEKVHGKARFLEASKALSDWREVVYVAEDSPLRHFKVLDHMVNEACCGFFTTESKAYTASLIYYFDFSGEPRPLGLTIDEYIQMMIAAKGFLYWQRALIDRARGAESPHVVSMKRDLPKIFADFDYETFVSRYDSLRN